MSANSAYQLALLAVKCPIPMKYDDNGKPLVEEHAKAAVEWAVAFQDRVELAATKLSKSKRNRNLRNIQDFQDRLVAERGEEEDHWG